jgi:hypothetical protein
MGMRANKGKRLCRSFRLRKASEKVATFGIVNNGSPFPFKMEY